MSNNETPRLVQVGREKRAQHWMRSIPQVLVREREKTTHIITQLIERGRADVYE